MDGRMRVVFRRTSVVQPWPDRCIQPSTFPQQILNGRKEASGPAT